MTGPAPAAGAPDGVFAVIHGVPAGVRLLRHPAIAAAGFTGSARGGLALQRICAERPVPIPFFGELGSVNPVVVLPAAAAARAEAIGAGYAASLTLGAGQFCTNPGLLFVPPDTGLTDAISGAVAASRGGPMLSERIHAGFEAGVAVTRAQHHGGPWPATTAPAYTSVGAAAIRRWLIPVVYQDCPPLLLPAGLRPHSHPRLQP